MKILPGAILCVILGLILGYWIEELTHEEHPGFYSCLDCGPTYAQTDRWWRDQRK